MMMMISDDDGNRDCRYEVNLRVVNVYFYIKKEYSSGRMLTSQVKQTVVDILVQKVYEHKMARAAVTDQVVRTFMTERPLIF
jgi:tryptophanyl-tRNA synthetase